MENIISLKNLSFSYDKRNVINNINLDIKRGSAIALIGENGSGKSTLLAMLAGIIRPSSGEISVFGSVSYLPQETALVEELTFEDNLKYFASLARCKVPHTLPFGADRLRKMQIKRMSGGMKKLCSICCALLNDADIYMFDEPCAALDKEHRAMLTEYIKDMVKRGKTVLYVAHNDAEYMAFANTVITVTGGEITVREASEAVK